MGQYSMLSLKIEEGRSPLDHPKTSNAFNSFVVAYYIGTFKIVCGFCTRTHFANDPYLHNRLLTESREPVKDQPAGDLLLVEHKSDETVFEVRIRGKHGVIGCPCMILVEIEEELIRDRKTYLDFYKRLSEEAIRNGITELDEIDHLVI